MSRLITFPLEKIRQKIDQTGIMKSNQKIYLTNASKENDSLVNSYNKMIDDLEDSAQRLAKTEREQAWQEMAKQVAHEIKNPLTPIQLAAERIKRKYKNHITLEPDIFLSCISTIIRQVDGMRKMVNEFSAFARMPAPSFNKINLTDLVKDITSLSILSNENILVNINVPKKILYAVVDEDQIRQALQNIISNGINSMIEREVNKKDKNIIVQESEKNFFLQKKEKLSLRQIKVKSPIK